MKFNRVLFYNFAHSGDIHVSRSLVKYTIDNIPANEYLYWHTQSPDILKDISNLRHTNVMSAPEDIMKWGWFVHEDRLMCNTWYHAFKSQEFKDCTIQTLFDIFKRGLKEIGNIELPGNPIDYLPEIDFESLLGEDKQCQIVDNMRKRAPVRRVLIVNCDVLSGQSDNFDFNPIVSQLSETFPSCSFIMSNIQNKIKLDRPNVCYASDIIQKDGCDLNEIAYISSFCSVIVGRASGPFTFSLIKRNLFDENKTFVCFSKEDFGVTGKIKAKMIMSEDYSESNVLSTIQEAIKERCLLWWTFL